MGNDDVVLVLLGRNVSFALEAFFEHHLSLGVKHILYVDNSSTDDSVDKAMRFGNITVASCSASFRKYQKYIRRLCAQKFHSGGWRLMLDADELFNYPGSDRVPLPRLTRALSNRGYTAVVAQMLDMVPPGRFLDYRTKSLREAVKAHVGYNLEAIDSYDYQCKNFRQNPGIDWFLDQNKTSNSDIRILFGGIRSLVFGEKCMLTKHPLLKMDRGVLLMPHPHISTGLNCADFSALISHYKFSGDFMKREALDLAENRRVGQAANELNARQHGFARDPNLSFNVPGLRKNPGTESLLADGFLVAGPEAHEYLQI